MIEASSVSLGTSAAWAATTTAPPLGMICYEYDTGRLKIGDGQTIYATLTLVIDSLFTQVFKTLLTRINQPDGVVQLDSNGLVPISTLPLSVKNIPLFVSNWTELNAIPLIDRVAAVFVVDATGDPSGAVTAGGAWYVWSTTTTSWVLVSTQTVVGLNPQDILMLNDPLDDLSDSATYVRMTVGERIKLASSLISTQTLVITAPPPSYWT